MGEKKDYTGGDWSLSIPELGESGEGVGGGAMTWGGRRERAWGCPVGQAWEDDLPFDLLSPSPLARTRGGMGGLQRNPKELLWPRVAGRKGGYALEGCRRLREARGGKPELRLPPRG